MPIVFDAPVTPGAATSFVREVPVQSTLSLLSAFPRQDLDTNTVNFSELVRHNRTARYRSFDGRLHVSERDASSEKRVNLIPLSSSSNLGEYERLQLEFARTQGTNRLALENAIYDDATNLTLEVQRRLEQAWGDVLTDGKLTINEGGLVGFEADFGVPANQLVSPAALWSDLTNGKPLDDIEAWTDIRTANGNGSDPGVMRTSNRVRRLLQRSKQVIDAVYGATQGRTRVNLTELNDLLASEGFPTLADAYDTQVEVDGVPVRTIPDDRVVFTPTDLSELGYTAWGVTATALELVGSNHVDFDFEDASGIVGVVVKEGPPFREFTFVDAVAMPILSNARKLMVADVA